MKKNSKGFFGFLILFVGFFFYFINQNPHYHSSNASHENVQIPDGYSVPSVKMWITQDQSGTWLLTVETENFTFAPEKVGDKRPSYNEGHAHLYINGEKINRLYGKYYNLGMLTVGENKVTVSLHSNNHGALTYKGKGIERSARVNVSYE